MRHPSLTIDSQMLKNVIEDLLLVEEMRHHIPIELTFQLKSQLNVCDIVSDLNDRQLVLVFFISIFSWLCD